ncbi:MAG: cytochrome P450 [Polyangiales bacterium]
MLPPGPKSPVAVTLFRWMRQPFALMEELRARYGETFTVDLGVMNKLVVLSNPEHVREVFASNGDDMHSGKVAVALKPFLGERSLILLDGGEHRRMRRLMMPPFHGERMQAYGAQMVDITHAAVDAMPVGRPFAIHKPMQSITMDVILRTVFGLDDAAVRDQMRSLLERLLEMGAWPPLLFPAFQRDLGPWSPWGRFARVGEKADRLLLEQIDRRRREDTAGRDDILSMFIDARDENGEPLSDVDLRDELITLLVAGHETTATGLAWTMHEVLQHPEVYAKLRDEVTAAERQGPLTPERIDKLPYVEAVIREALRVHPIIPLVGRMLQQPMRVAGYELPEGAIVAPSVYLVHHNPAVYPDPYRFAPERFVGKKPAAWEWIPFGGGVRRCIGMAFALYEMKMVLATLVSRTWMHAAPGYTIRPVRRSITLSPSEGMPVVLDARLPRERAREAA